MGGVVCACNFGGDGPDESCGVEITGGPPNLFVDAVAEVTYDLNRPSMSLFKDDVFITKVSKADFDGNVIKVLKGERGFQDDKLLRVSGPVAGWEQDWFSVATSCGREISKEDFIGEYGGRAAVHIKGFSSGTASVYDECITDRLKKFEVLAWDGEDYDNSSFTRLVPLYLNTNSKGVAVAFKRRFGIPGFNQGWSSVMAKHPGRILVVPIDEDRDAEVLGASSEVATYCDAPSKEQRRAFLLARVALKTTGAAEVVALGGEGSAAWEAQASFPDDVHWTVYAASRGQKERQPSLCDFAKKTLMKKNSGAHVHLVMGRDPNESDAFSRGF